MNTTEILTHPLLLALEAAILAMIAPWIARNWQRNQKAQDIQGQIVIEMAEIIAAPIADARLMARGRSLLNRTEGYDEVLRTLAIRGANIQVRLAAYLSQYPTITSIWADLVAATEILFRLGNPDDSPDRRAENVETAKVRFAALRLNSVDWKTIIEGNTSLHFEREFDRLAQGVIAENSHLLALIVGRRIKLP